MLVTVTTFGGVNGFGHIDGVFLKANVRTWDDIFGGPEEPLYGTYPFTAVRINQTSPNHMNDLCWSKGKCHWVYFSNEKENVYDLEVGYEYRFYYYTSSRLSDTGSQYVTEYNLYWIREL